MKPKELTERLQDDLKNDDLSICENIDSNDRVALGKKALLLTDHLGKQLEIRAHVIKAQAHIIEDRDKEIILWRRLTFLFAAALIAVGLMLALRGIL